MYAKQPAFSSIHMPGGSRKIHSEPSCVITTHPSSLSRYHYADSSTILMANGFGDDGAAVVVTPVATLTTVVSQPTPSTTFEPVLNVPALGTFVLIMSMALFLWLRGNSINEATEIRLAALDKLRDAKSKELNNEVTSEAAEEAVAAYEKALLKEENLRTLLPGIRIRSPNDPKKSLKDQQAVRQFLTKKESNEILLPMMTETEQGNGDDKDGSRSSILQSPIALGMLLSFLFGTQFLLFAFLNMDDTTANEVLNSIAAESSYDPSTASSMIMEQASTETTVAETIVNVVGME